jgi:hypothetical protein
MDDLTMESLLLVEPEFLELKQLEPVLVPVLQLP